MFVLKKTNGKYLLLGKAKPKDGDICYNAEKDTIERFIDLSDAGVGQGAYLKIIATFDNFDQFMKKFIDAKTTWLVEVELETEPIEITSTIGISEFFKPKITDGYINITKIAVKHPFNV